MIINFNLNQNKLNNFMQLFWLLVMKWYLSTFNLSNRLTNISFLLFSVYLCFKWNLNVIGLWDTSNTKLKSSKKLLLTIKNDAILR